MFSISDFFIRRPVLATVCSAVVALLGVVCILILPVSQYPEITPPTVSVVSNYVGANAEVVEATVTNILERELNGIEGLRYISSTSGNDGTSNIVLTFNLGRNQDLAAVDVQNRVATVTSRLPAVVQQTGVRVNKSGGGFIFAIGVYAEDGPDGKPLYDDLYLSNYADLYIVDVLRRIQGVSNVQIFGERQYAMRIWLDPDRLAARGLTAQDVVAALREQNLQVGVGQIGQQPAAPDQTYQLSISASGRFTTEAEFETMVLRAEAGDLVQLRDVGRVELGAENYASVLRFNGRRAIGLGIRQLPDANALAVARQVKKALANLAPDFPPGIRYEIAFDTTAFIEEGAREVMVSLLLAVGLVVIILYVFLQDWRSTLIPALVIPIALVGTFLFVRLLNFNINTLTLFGLTLASGLVVDDAIVIVEDIARRIRDENKPPLQAAIDSMNRLVGAVIATSLVLIAVFVPVAFFPGIVGQLYKQFALTIAFAVTISTLNAITFTPTLSALLLRSNQALPDWRFFRWVNRTLDGVRRRYRRTLAGLTRKKILVFWVFVAGLGLTYFTYNAVPSAFLPDEDQGYFITIVQAPEGVSLSYTERVLTKIEEAFRQPERDAQGQPVLDENGRPKPKFPQIENIFAVGGFSFSGTTPNQGIVFATLKPWSKRPGWQSAGATIGQLFPSLLGIREAIVIPFPPPAIIGLGSVGGFEYQLQDRGNRGFVEMGAVLNQLLAAAGTYPSPTKPQLVGLRPEFNANTPQLTVEVDREKAAALGIPLVDVFTTLQTQLGSQYVNDFDLFGRAYRVYVQADRPFRSTPEDIAKLYVRSRSGEMISLGNLVQVRSSVGPSLIAHYNLARSVKISGSAAPGVSSGQAIAAMEKLSQQVLPRGFSYEWTGLSLEEKELGGQAVVIFAMGLVFVFLVLSAQYENFIDPFIILLVVPVSVLGALWAVALRGVLSALPFVTGQFWLALLVGPPFAGANDVYTQIGLVMLIGLASKNSILIVELANQLRAEGFGIAKAAVEAAQLRLRPILMTALSTAIGVFPLMIASGAGAAARQSLGTAVFGGTLAAILLSLFITPIFYIIVKNLVERPTRGGFVPEESSGGELPEGQVSPG